MTTRMMIEMTAWKELKAHLQLANIDVDYPKQYIQLPWSQLRRILEEEGWRKK